MKLKLKPISERQRKGLERTIDYPVCPLTVKETDYPLHIGLYLNAGPVNKYKCSVDGGPARGGNASTLMFFTAVSPCSTEYAKQCPLYQKAKAR